MVGMVVTTSPILDDRLQLGPFMTPKAGKFVPLIYIEALSSQRCPVRRKLRSLGIEQWIIQVPRLGS